MNLFKNFFLFIKYFIIIKKINPNFHFFFICSIFRSKMSKFIFLHDKKISIQFFFYDLEFLYTFDLSHSEHPRRCTEAHKQKSTNFFTLFPGSYRICWTSSLDALLSVSFLQSWGWDLFRRFSGHKPDSAGEALKDCCPGISR